MCRCVSDKIFFTGYMYVSDNYIAFAGDKRLPIATTTTTTGPAPPANSNQYGTYRLAFLLPLKNVVSIHKGSCVTQQGQLPPIVEPIPLGSAAKPEAVIVYTADGTMHHFYSFFNLEHTFNVLDHAWRSSFTQRAHIIPPLPIPLDQPMPAIKPIERKDRPGLSTNNPGATVPTQSYVNPYHQPPPPQASYQPGLPQQPGMVPMSGQYDVQLQMQQQMPPQQMQQQQMPSQQMPPQQMQQQYQQVPSAQHYGAPGMYAPSNPSYGGAYYPNDYQQGFPPSGS